jgi:DNA-binding response OmpR family regulator
MQQDLSDNRAPRVLIVEDDRHLCAFLAESVAACGIVAVQSGTLADAMRNLRPLPDAVLLDLHLPDGSGLALLRHVRDAALPVPVAVTTGTADRKLLAELEGLRPERVFRKPFGLPRLMGWIKSVCDAAAAPAGGGRAGKFIRP